MGVRGDFAKLRLLARQVKKVGSTSALRELNRNLAEEARELVLEGFDEERAPDGAAWAPITHRIGRILQDTGQLRNSWKVKKVTARGFTVSASAKHASYHQTGTSRMPARPMVPGGDLPGSWRRAFESAATDYLKSILDV